MVIEPSEFSDQKDLEELIKSRLKIFYGKRINKLESLTLKFLTTRKNPYLLRATGIDTASDLVTDMMLSYLIKSDETVFGKDFFEEIAKSVGNAERAKELGMDIVIETDDLYTVAEIKSSANWKNARMDRGLKRDFNNAFSEFSKRNIDKKFRAMLGQSVGCRNINVDLPEYESVIRSGQAFWAELTGDKDFYLKLITYMGNYPSEHRAEYLEAWKLTHNRLNREFSIKYVSPDGQIDWNSFLKDSSGDRR